MTTTAVSSAWTCDAKDCKVTSARKPWVGAFKFPENPERQQAWLALCGRHDLLDSHGLEFRVLCAEHFEDDQFVNQKKRVLIAGANPTIFAQSVSHLEEPTEDASGVDAITEFDPDVDDTEEFLPPEEIFIKDEIEDTPFAEEEPERKPSIPATKPAAIATKTFSKKPDPVPTKGKVVLQVSKEIYEQFVAGKITVDQIKAMQQQQVQQKQPQAAPVTVPAKPTTRATSVLVADKRKITPTNTVVESAPKIAKVQQKPQVVTQKVAQTAEILLPDGTKRLLMLPSNMSAPQMATMLCGPNPNKELPKQMPATPVTTVPQPNKIQAATIPPLVASNTPFTGNIKSLLRNAAPVVTGENTIDFAVSSTPSETVAEFQPAPQLPVPAMAPSAPPITFNWQTLRPKAWMDWPVRLEVFISAVEQLRANYKDMFGRRERMDIETTLHLAAHYPYLNHVTKAHLRARVLHFLKILQLNKDMRKAGINKEKENTT